MRRLTTRQRRQRRNSIALTIFCVAALPLWGVCMSAFILAFPGI